jgi:hypothetical protein
MVAGILAHEDRVAVAAAVGAAQVGVDGVLHAGDAGAHQGVFDLDFCHFHRFERSAWGFMIK